MLGGQPWLKMLGDKAELQKEQTSCLSIRGQIKVSSKQRQKAVLSPAVVGSNISLLWLKKVCLVDGERPGGNKKQKGKEKDRMVPRVHGRK